MNKESSFELMEPGENLPPKIPLFSQNNFPPLFRVNRDKMEISVSYSPLKDPLFPKISIHKEGMKPLEVFSAD